jgi:hypothetical protein
MLADAYTQGYTDGIYGIEAVQRTIDYYQGALINVSPELRGTIHLALGKSYHQLCFHEWKEEMAKCSIDHLELALKCPVDSDQWRQAANCKTYLSIILTIGNRDDERAKSKLGQWIEFVINSSNDPATITIYSVLSHCWPTENQDSGRQNILQFCNSALWFSRSSLWNSLSIVHVVAVLGIAPLYPQKDTHDLRDRIDTLHHLERFFELADWRDLTLCARMIPGGDDGMKVAELWKGVYARVLGEFGDLLYKLPSFPDAAKFPTDEDIARVTFLLEGKARKPIPRQVLE